jgi:hypothetical protein
MKYYILFFISLFFIGCSTPRFYPEIASTYENYDTLVSKHGKEAVSKSSFDSHKLVMRKLSSYLKNSDHIIYHYSRTTRKWRGKEFSGVVFDAVIVKIDLVESRWIQFINILMIIIISLS